LASGEAIKIVDPYGNATRRWWGPDSSDPKSKRDGLIHTRKWEQDPAGNQTSYEYDDQTGNRTRIVDAAGKETRFDFKPDDKSGGRKNGANKRDWSIDARSSGQASGSAPKTLNEYTDDSDLKKVTDPGGNVTEYEYTTDRTRRLLKVFDANSEAAGKSWRTDYQYDAHGQSLP
jgi:YD repeat-containing protein